MPSKERANPMKRQNDVVKLRAGAVQREANPTGRSFQSLDSTLPARQLQPHVMRQFGSVGGMDDHEGLFFAGTAKNDGRAGKKQHAFTQQTHCSLHAGHPSRTCWPMASIVIQHQCLLFL